MIKPSILNRNTLYKFTNIFIALVWFINGIYCKVLNFVPRHQEIVSRILGPSFSDLATIFIGIGELAIGIWMLTNFRSKLNAIFQIVLIITMNIIEFIMVPDLLLWGKFNLIFALVFTLIIYINEFIIKHETNQNT